MNHTHTNFLSTKHSFFNFWKKRENNVWYDTNMVGKYVDKVLSCRWYYRNGMMGSSIDGFVYNNTYGTDMTTCITLLEYEMYIGVYDTNLCRYVWRH